MIGYYAEIDEDKEDKVFNVSFPNFEEGVYIWGDIRGNSF